MKTLSFKVQSAYILVLKFAESMGHKVQKEGYELYAFFYGRNH